jgi:hypothetical protein
MIYNAIRVEVNYSPRLSPAEQLLLSLPNRMRNLRPFMIGSLAPWAPSTLAARIRKGNAAKGILRDTDHLYKTLFRARATDNRLRVIRNGLRLQLNVGVPFAIFHQLGTSFMPERQVIPDPLPNSFIRQARHLLKQFLLTGRAINA